MPHRLHPGPMKYIVFKSPRGEAPVLFPHEFIHSWVAGQMRPLEVVAAGFVEIADGVVRCYGHSSSLRIASRGDRDSQLITKNLRAVPPGDAESPMIASS